ncbi:MAG: glycine oxidase ThiO [Lysinibacillus sp.]
MSDYDVIVIGGGVIGSSTALRLAQANKSVAVFDARKARSGASRAAGGMLGAQNEFTQNSPLFALAKCSRAMFPDLREELLELTDIDIQLSHDGLLKVATYKEDVAQLKSQYDFLVEDDPSVKWLEGEDLPVYESLLSSNIHASFFIPHDGQVHAPSLTNAYVKAAVNEGVHLYEDEPVQSIIMEGNVVKGVTTARKTYYAKQVLIATGAWSSKLLHDDWITPIKGECLSIHMPNVKLKKTIFSTDGCYIVPKKEGHFLIGATSKENSFDETITAAGIHSLLTRAMRLLPSLQQGHIESMWTSFRPRTQDGVPIMGKHPSIQNLFISTGHYRNGILLSAFSGKAMADYMCDMPNAETVLSPFAPTRLVNEKRAVKM